MTGETELTGWGDRREEVENIMFVCVRGRDFCHQNLLFITYLFIKLIKIFLFSFECMFWNFGSFQITIKTSFLFLEKNPIVPCSNLIWSQGFDQ